jgi:hypothetical protein
MRAEHVGGNIYEVERRCGFLWLRKERAKAFWKHGAWFWVADGKPILELDTQIALHETHIRVNQVINFQKWKDRYDY